MEWTVGTAAELKVAFSDPRLQQAAWSCTGAPCTWGSMWVGTLSCNLSVPRVAAWQGKVCKSFPGSFLGPIAPPWTFSTFFGALVGWMGGAATLSSKSWLWVCPAVPNSAIWSLTKEPKNIHWKKVNIFNKRCRGNWLFTHKSGENRSLMPCTKTNSILSKTFNVGTGALEGWRNSFKT